MTETITRDLQGLVAAMYAEADMCETLEITKPAALLREAAAVIQPEANSQTMDMFAEVTSAGHLAELVDNLRMSLHHQADEFDLIEELSGASCAATLREIAGDHKPHRKPPILPPDDAQVDRVRRIEENGPYPGMSIAFERHIGVECAWTEPENIAEAGLWAAAWKAATRHAADQMAAERERWRALLVDVSKQTRHPDYDWPLCLQREVDEALGPNVRGMRPDTAPPT